MKLLSTELPNDQSLPLDFSQVLLNHLWGKHNEAILVLGSHGIIELITPEFEAVVCEPSVRLLGENISHYIVRASDSAEFLEEIENKRFSLKGKCSFEGQWKSSNGKLFPIAFKAYSSGRNPEKTLCILEKLPQWKISQCPNGIPTQGYLEQILDKISAVMWMSSFDGETLYYMSPNFDRLYEISDEGYQKVPKIHLDRIHPEDLQKFLKLYTPEENLSRHQVGFRYRLNDGTYRHITAYRFFVYDESGQPVKVAGISVDDTHLYEAQLKLKVHQSEIEKRNEYLSKVNQIVEDLVSITIHDLGQPLRMLTASAHMLGQEVLSPEAQEIVMRFERALYTMKELVEGLKKSTTFEEALQSTREVDVGRLIELNLMPLFHSEISHGAVIEFQNLHPLRVNPEHVNMLFKNLIENAIKYNKDTPHIKICSKKFKSGVAYSVQDNGIGIDPQYHRKIFEKGERLHQIQEAEGSGIGLAGCQNLVSLYGGNIWVHSRGSEGSTFYLFFPNHVAS